MSQVLFGPAGNSDSFKARYRSFADVPKYTAEMGLNAFEYQFGRGVRMSEENAAVLKAGCEQYGVTMSAHAPYYISLSSADEQKRINSARYLLETARALRGMGGRRIVLHSGSVGKFSREQAVLLAMKTVAYCVKALDEAGYSDMILCPETMGKINQLGTLEEVMRLCSVDERIIPCIDFGHLNARSHGGIATKEDYLNIFAVIENALGAQRLGAFHCHFSKIEYTAGGERKHLTFEDRCFGPDPRPLMEIIAKRGFSPCIICESDGTQAEDAGEMKSMYEKMKSGKGNC